MPLKLPFEGSQLYGKSAFECRKCRGKGEGRSGNNRGRKGYGKRERKEEEAERSDHSEACSLQGPLRSECLGLNPVGGGGTSL